MTNECLRVGMPAPDFAATAVVDQEFKDITLSQYRGKYVVLFWACIKTKDTLNYWAIFPVMG